MATNPVASAIANAKKALENANKFTKNVTQGQPDAFAPEPKPSYSMVRQARKSPDEFLGVRSNEAPEINEALRKREEAKKALQPQ